MTPTETFLSCFESTLAPDSNGFPVEILIVMVIMVAILALGGGVFRSKKPKESNGEQNKPMQNLPFPKSHKIMLDSSEDANPFCKNKSRYNPQGMGIFARFWKWFKEN